MKGNIFAILAVLLLLTACGNKATLTTQLSGDTLVVNIKNPQGYLMLPIEYGAPACEVAMEADGASTAIGNVSVAQNKIDDYVPVPLNTDGNAARLLVLHVPAKACFADSVSAVETLTPDLFTRKMPAYHYALPYGKMDVPAAALLDGTKYHLYFEFNPYGIDAANICWGHVASETMTSWETLPVAIGGDSIGEALGGSCVLDKYSSFGAGMNAMVCLYTATRGEGPDRRQEQCIAYAHNADSPLQKFSTNPVLRTYDDIPDFRHPSVVRFKRENMWDVVIACGDHLRIYSSDDLANWNLESRLGQGWFGNEAVYESGRLVEGTAPDGKPTWFLICNVKPKGNASAEQCVAAFWGSFDGKTFRPETEQPALLDAGQTYFGALPFENVSGRVLLAGLLSNEAATNSNKTLSVMALPRELSLVQAAGETRFCLKPAQEAEALRKEENKQADATVEGEKDFGQMLETCGGACELYLSMQGENARGLLLYNNKGEAVRLTFRPDGPTDLLQVDCEGSDGSSVARLPKSDTHSLRIFIDRNWLEIFADDGLAAVSQVLSLNEPLAGVKLFSESGTAKAADFRFYTISQ